MIFNRNSVNYVAATLIVFFGVTIGSYRLLQAEAARITKKKSAVSSENMQGGRVSNNDPSLYVPESNLNPPDTNILVQQGFLKAPTESVVRDDIKLATKGDGAFRNVQVNGKGVPREYVLDSFFRNQDYMPRMEYPLEESPAFYDPQNQRQSSMFGPIKKMANGNGFGIDVIRDDTNTFINVAQLGGRYEE